jgi:hypothetical protein
VLADTENGDDGAVKDHEKSPSVITVFPHL